MPQLIFFALVAIAGWLLYSKFVNDAKKLSKKSQAERKERETGAQGTLVEDPETGEYRLKKDEE